MRQEELFNGFSDREAGARLLEIIERAVTRMGVKVFADLIHRDPSQVRSALNPEGDKKYAVEWTAALLRRDSIFAEEYINFQCDLTGKEYPRDKRRLTPEEKITLYEEVISRHGLELLFKEKS